MSASDSHVAAGSSRYPRSAHATIRGYLYQTCLGVLRWLDLQPNEILLCEGDEDLDRFLLGGGSVSEQVKAYSGKLSLSNQAVLDSLRGFLQSYVTLRQNGEARSFVFTTTAQPSRERKSGLDFDLLEAWRNGGRSPKVLNGVRTLLIIKSKKDKKDKKDAKDNKKDKIRESVAWLDGQPEGWKAFLDSVKWSFDAPDLDAIRQTIRNRLAAREDTRPLPAEMFLQRLVVRVLDASIQEDLRGRTLTPKDLSDLVDTARIDLGNWSASPEAQQIQKVFSELDLLHDLLDEGTRKLPEKPTHGQLLTAAFEVIPFAEQGRKDEFASLEAWCSSKDRRSVLLLTGEGGSGKTRLLLEWCSQMRHQGWHAGFLKRNREKNQVLSFLKGTASRLVVIDYAETRLGIVEALLDEMGQAPEEEGPKLRVVLLARWAGDWWGNLTRKNRDVRNLPKETRQLRSLIPEVETRRQAFRIAVEAFAWRLRRNVPADLEEPDLSKKNFDRALYLHMASLAALDRKQIQSAEDALKETLVHERQFWDQMVEAEVSDRSLAKVLQEAITSSVAALTLTGGAADQQQAKTLLDRILASFPLQSHHPVTLLRLLRGLYGGGQGGSYLEPLQPDLLGEQLVAETLGQDGDLLGRVLDGGSDAEASSTLTVLTRLAQRQPELGGWLRTAFQGRLGQLAELALDVAVGTGDPIGLALAEELEQEAPPELMVRLQKKCDDERYRYSVPLREVACIATGKVLVVLKKQGNLDESQMHELSRLALHLGNRLSDLGHREDALRATQEAVEIRRQLAKNRPDAFLPDLARSLTNLGPMLRALGHREDALRANEEAVEICRQLAKTEPDAYLPVLATSLINLGTMLSNLGRREDALSTTQEAVEIRRQFAQTRPSAFLSDLAMSLTNLGAKLSDLGYHEDALSATQEAVGIRRQLAQTRPDAFLPGLATSLNNLGHMLSELGHREDALSATREAVEIYRQLAQTRPDAFLPNLAPSLTNLGNMLAELGYREDALSAAREAVEIYRQLTQTRPDAFLPELALSLNNQGIVLSELSLREDALRVTQEAVKIRRQLAQTRPGTFLSVLASSISNLGTMLGELGRREEALGATQEAVELRRQLAQTLPDAFLPDLAGSLNNLGNNLSDLGHRKEAFSAGEEAVRTLAPFFLRRPASFTSLMVTTVGNYLRHAEAAGKEPDAGLLAPIVEVFKSLSPSQNSED